MQDVSVSYDIPGSSGSDNQTSLKNTAQSPSTAVVNPQINSTHILTDEEIEKPAHENANNLPQIINNTPPEMTDEVFTVVEEYPTFPGGDRARIKFLQQNIHYPKEALQNHQEGKVVINFIVEKDGSVSNLKVLNSIGRGCDDEAFRVAKMMPKWNPGKQSGVPVRVSFNMPISFMLKIKESSKMPL